MTGLLTPEVIASFLTLTLLEIVLGIDNLVFISILSDKLPKEQRQLARRLGLALALITRLILLFMLTWIASLTTDIFTLFNEGLSWRDLILIGGGLFLLIKGTLEIHDKIDEKNMEPHAVAARQFSTVIIQIGIMDMVFSLDSIITAVGIAKHIEVMVAAIVVSMAVMVLAVNTVSDFVSRHPTVKMLALSFLLLIGMSLVAEGLDFEIPKGYIYFAMLFSLFVEAMNLLVRRNSQHK